jgi:hypothetical protein
VNAAGLARLALVIGWGVLVAVLAGWHLSRFSPVAAAIALLFTAGPWLAIAPVLWRRHRQAHVLAVILATATMAYALTEVLTNRGAHAWAATTLFAAFAVFIAAAAWLRFSRPASP